MVLRIAVVALAAALVADPVAPGPQKRGQSQEPKLLIPFGQGFDQALESALTRNLPIVLMLTIEDVESNDQFVDKSMSSKLLAQRSLDYLPLWGNPGTHGTAQFEVGVDAEGEPVFAELCEKFRTPTCKAHQEVMDAAWNEFADDEGALGTPQVIVILPSAKVDAMIYDGNPVSDKTIIRQVDRAIEKAGPGLSADDLNRIKAAIVGAERALQKADIGEEWRQWQVVLDATTAAHWTDQARQGQTDALAAMQAEFADIVAREESGESGAALEAYQAWSARIKTWAGTPLVPDIEKRMKLLERGKDTRDAIKAWQRTQEAQALLDEATELFKRGQDRKAERVVKNLLRKYADTPAGERAAKKWPDLVPEK